MIIRKLEDKDCESVAQVARSAIDEVWPKFRSRHSIEVAKAKFTTEYFIQMAKEVEYWVAETDDGDRVIGLVGLRDGEVRSFFVAAEYLNQGIGKALMKQVELAAKQRRFEELRVCSSEAAEQIYEKLGFRKIQVIPETIGGEGVKEILMKKFL